MIRKLLLAAVAAAAVGAAGFFLLTVPKTLAAGDLPAHEPDVANGKRMFDAGGCTGCHAAPETKGDERLKLAGGLALKTDFGTFHAPNISPDPEHGIGSWTTEQFVGAMMRGVSADGEHLYPAFPYTSYARMKVEDVIDLFAYIKTLPSVATDAPAHELGFPFNIRRGLGLWKLLYLDPSPVVALPADAPEAARRGQYLAEGPGHCGECHTPRDPIGGLDKAQWLAGAPNPEGKGTIPNITPGEGGIPDWSADDIATALETGFKPDYDSFGGSMVEVQENMAKLPAEDRAAIAAYLKAVPAHPDAVKAPAEPASGS
jgi:mono/diheme cytochrome c family protein